MSKFLLVPNSPPPPLRLDHPIAINRPTRGEEFFMNRLALLKEVYEKLPMKLLFRGSNEHCLFPFSINEEGGVRSSLASEARLFFYNTSYPILVLFV